MLIRGTKVVLRAAVLADRRAIWEWATRSDLTHSMMGTPDFPENPVPTWDEFCADYPPYFFDGSKPHVGRSFIIEHQGLAVGHINYGRGDERPNFAELDIWMRDSTCCGHGWGSEALIALSRHLHDDLRIHEQILRPSARNVRAIRSYEKAGFSRLNLRSNEHTARYGPGEYHDTIVMQRLPDVD